MSPIFFCKHTRKAFSRELKLAQRAIARDHAQIALGISRKQQKELKKSSPKVS